MTDMTDQTWAHNLLRDIILDDTTPGPIKRKIRAGLQPTEADYRGCRMFVHPSDNNTEFQIWKIGRTQEEKPLKAILKRLEGRKIYVFDVGANAGSFSIRIAKAAMAGSVVHAFEPNPIMRSRLTKNAELNALNDLQINPCAISNEAGVLQLHLPDVANFGQARLYEGYEGGKTVDVDVKPLSDFAPKDPDQKVDFLKVDVEGFEDRVIVPYLEQTDPAHHPEMIFFEHKHDGLWTYDLDSALDNANYKIVREYGRNSLFEKA